jgi:hypothetical protein
MSVKLNVRTKPDLKKVALPLRKFRLHSIERHFENLATVVLRNVRDAAPERTGVGKRAIVKRKRKGFVWEILIDRRRKGGNYMSWQHDGVPAHKINPIEPKRRKFLWWPGARHPVRIVTKHPGIPASKFIDKGLEASRGNIATTEKVIAADVEARLLKK